MRTAQLYHDADYVRVFDNGQPIAICDAFLAQGMDRPRGCRKSADKALARVGMCRKGRWRKTEWGFTATLKGKQ